MENQGQYLKYKPVFKQIAILKVCMYPIMLLSIILFFFLPCFSMGPESAELGGFGINFSLYDETAYLISLFFSDVTTGAWIGTFLLQMIAVLMFAGGIVSIIVDLVQSALRYINPENYAILEYDRIKTRAGRSRFYAQYNPASMFFAAVILEVGIIAYSKIFGPSSSRFVYIDYFSFMNGVAWGFWIVLIFMIADITLSLITTLMRNKVKVQILKEDYEQQAPPANEDPFSSV